MIHEMTDEAWNNAIAWTLNAAFWLTRRVLPDMMSRKWGRIINMSSIEGKQATSANIAHYITNKHGLNGFTKATAFEYCSYGVTCNAICPGAIETERMLVSGPAFAEAAGITYEDFKQHYADASAIKRLNTVEEVAAVAAFIESTNAERTWGSFQATEYQCSVQCWMGQVSTFDLSKPNSTMVTMGANKKKRTAATQSHSPARANRDLFIGPRTRPGASRSTGTRP